MKRHFVLAVGIALSAMASTPKHVSADRSPRLLPPPVTMQDSIVALARKQIGKKYVYGAETPARGFDCSGLVQYVFAGIKLELPRTAAAQARIGYATRTPLPGDLLLFGPTGESRVVHVGIYSGAGRYISASSIAGQVVERPLTYMRVLGVRRILSPFYADEAHWDVSLHGKQEVTSSNLVVGSAASK